jgi:hypothetical protein
MALPRIELENQARGKTPRTKHIQSLVGTPGARARKVIALVA